MVEYNCYNCEYPMEEQEFNNPNNPEEPPDWRTATAAPSRHAREGWPHRECPKSMAHCTWS